MAVKPRDKVRKEKYKARAQILWLGDHDDIESRKEVVDRLMEWTRAVDSSDTRFTGPETHSPNTIEAYLGALRRFWTDEGLNLLDTSADELNDLTATMKKDRNLSGVTMAKYQSAAKSFYSYHDDLEVDHTAIHVDSERSSPRHDRQDLYTEAEVWALRNACNGPKERALLELLIYTGQRIRALLTLKVEDVDLDGGNIYLNEKFDSEQGGLKGALKRGRRRVILGATKYVRDWIQYHPHRAEYDDWPDADEWLFVGDPSNANTAIGDHWSDGSAREALERIANRAGIDKPPNPHCFRHYTCTTLYRDWDWNEREIKAQLGLAKDSTIFETTYSHITDDEFLDAGEAKWNGGDGQEENAEESLTPPTCPSCSEVLKPHYTECPNPSCSERFGPDQEPAEPTITISKANDAMAKTFTEFIGELADENELSIPDAWTDEDAIRRQIFLRDPEDPRTVELVPAEESDT